MKWLLLIAGIFVLITLALLIFGLMQAVKHSVTRSIHLKQPPDTVFAVISDSANLPTWSSSIEKVEKMPDQNGNPAFRCWLSWGGMRMIMTQLESAPPNRLVISMAKDGGPVLGTWTYNIDSDPDGCTIALTEEGELKNPFFRALARIRGLDANITQTLRDLAKKFGENPDVRSTAS
jgi:uncharacterized protein YndB with AHSA1/START domain